MERPCSAGQALSDPVVVEIGFRKSPKQGAYMSLVCFVVFWGFLQRICIML